MPLHLDIEGFARNPGFMKLGTFFKWLANLKHGQLFRGQPRIWPITPSVYRPEAVGIQTEAELNEWVALAGPFVFGIRPQTPLEWLVLAQHHAIPTPLIDWTTSPLIALYFACQSHASETGQVFALVPQDYPIAHQTLMIEVFNEETPNPLLVVPARSFHPRAAIQHSVMTLVRGAGVAALAQKPPRAFEVRAEDKAYMLEALRTLGIDGVTLMADVQTAANEFLNRRVR